MVISEWVIFHINKIIFLVLSISVVLAYLSLSLDMEHELDEIKKGKQEKGEHENLRDNMNWRLVHHRQSE